LGHETAPVAGTFVDASGTDLTGATRAFRAYQGSDGIYRLISDLDNFETASSSLPPEGYNPIGGSVTLSLGGQDRDPLPVIQPVQSRESARLGWCASRYISGDKPSNDWWGRYAL